MASNSILYTLDSPILCLFVFFSSFFGYCHSFDDFVPHNTFTVSSLTYPDSQLQPFQLRYFRVELPPWFSSLSISLNSDVNLDITKARKIPKRALPIICFREGSPPLPEASNTSIIDSGLAPLTNISIEGIQGHQNLEQCYPMQRYIEVKLTNEQISPGVWYFGLFNGVGSSRTQSKMIVRGPSYSFSANVTVEGCSSSTMFGQYCNQTVDPLSCSLSDGRNIAENVLEAMSYNRTVESLLACGSTFKTFCLRDGELKTYHLDMEGVAEELTISATNVSLNLTKSDSSSNISGISLMGFARLGAIPSVVLHDYSSNLTTGPLVIRSPKVGRWYISIAPLDLSKELRTVPANNVSVCYSMESYVLHCPYGKTGPIFLLPFLDSYSSMADHLARAEDFDSKAEKKLSGWGLFGSKYDDAADLFDKAANSYKLSKSWDKAGSTYIKLANCHLKMESKHEAAQAYIDAGNCYKKTSVREAISCIEQAVNLFCDIGRLNMAARYYKEIAELFESEQDIEQAIDYFEKAADLFQNEEVTTSANQCKQKVAQFAAQLEQYQKAIDIYEEIAKYSLKSNLLKYGVKGHLLNAGICQLCKGDIVAITKALDNYQDLDPTFSGSREYKLLADIASAIDEEDVAKFTDVVKEFDSMTTLDPLKTTLLLRVKDKLKAKELEEDDLT